jgi:hypothetical protein
MTRLRDVERRSILRGMRFRVRRAMGSQRELGTIRARDVEQQSILRVVKYRSHRQIAAMEAGRETTGARVKILRRNGTPAQTVREKGVRLRTFHRNDGRWTRSQIR